MRSTRHRPTDTFEDSLPDDDILTVYKTTDQVKQAVRYHQGSPDILAQTFPQLGALYEKESHDSLSILAPLRPQFRGLERMTFNVGYACMGGFALGTLLGLGRVLPHSKRGLEMGESLSVVIRRSLRVAREEGANGLRRWGCIVTFHSMLEAVTRYMLWNTHHKSEAAAPEPVMVTDNMDPRLAMQASIKEPARRSLASYDLRNMHWEASPNKYPFSLLESWPPQDPRVIPVWTSIPLMVGRAAIFWNSMPKIPLLASCVAYPAVVYLWQSRMPPDTYMDLQEEFVPDESMM